MSQRKPVAFKGPRLVQTQDEVRRERELKRMKFIATALLVIAFIIFVVAKLYESQYPWLGFVRATAEAAMVGALADWFAVTALFRYPLNLKIPHTAIIPNRKDSIGRSLGRFVQNNFLASEVVQDKLRAMRLTEQAAVWISRNENAKVLVEHATTALKAVVRVINDEDIQAVIDRNLQARLQGTQLAPLLGRVLTLVLSGNREQELLSATFNLLAHLMEENEAAIQDKIQRETPWWLPRSVDQAIYVKIIETLRKTLTDLNDDPDHPLHQQFKQLIEQFIDDLQNSPDIASREDALKAEFMQHPMVREFSSSLWRDIKNSLLDPDAQTAIDFHEPLELGLVQFGQAILNDTSLMRKVDQSVESLVLFLVREYGYEVEQLIAQTISYWDAEATSQKIELQVGKDLQFIRINGTLVGGLAGLLIYTFSLLL